MKDIEYRELQEKFRSKLKKPPFEGWQSDKYHTGYEKGVEACMSILSSHHRQKWDYPEATTDMDINTLEDLAFNGAPMPDLRSQAQVLLFQSFRDLYDFARRSGMSPEQGKREKAQILEAYKINKFLEELQESTNDMWGRIEEAAMAYRKSPSVEAADRLMKALYSVERKTS